MDSTFFHLKRAHLRTLAFERQQLKPFGITPARFDLLYALYNSKEGFCMGADLVRALGTVKSNVCRLLHALEKLRLIYWDIDGREERRGAMWELTEKGEELVKRIISATQASVRGMAAKCADPPPPPEKETRAKRLIRFLQGMRIAFFDTLLLDVYTFGVNVRCEEIFHAAVAERRDRRRAASKKHIRALQQQREKDDWWANDPVRIAMATAREANECHPKDIGAWLAARLLAELGIPTKT